MAATEIVRAPNGEFAVSNFASGVLPAAQGAAATGDNLDLGKFIEKGLGVPAGQPLREVDITAARDLLAEARAQMGLPTNK